MTINQCQRTVNMCILIIKICIYFKISGVRKGVIDYDFTFLTLVSV